MRLWRSHLRVHSEYSPHLTLSFIAGAKKLPCNHIFHAACLRLWFQRQQTCPTCRLNVLRAPAPETAAPPAAAPPQPAAAAPLPPPPFPNMPPPRKYLHSHLFWLNVRRVPAPAVEPRPFPNMPTPHKRLHSHIACTSSVSAECEMRLMLPPHNI